MRYDFAVSLFQSGFYLQDSTRELEVPYEGSLWADADNYDLVRIETRAVEIPAELDISKAITIVDYAPVQFGEGPSFVLPRSARGATAFWSGAENHNRTEFRNCRRFGSSSDISFDANLAEAETSPPASDDILIPAGVSLRLRLTEPIDSSSSKVGDLIAARLEADATHDGRMISPKAAEVVGRIRRLEYYNEEEPFYLLGIEFSEMRFGGRTARFVADLERFLPVPGLVFSGPSHSYRSQTEVVSSARIPSRIKHDRIETFTDVRLAGVGVVPIKGRQFQIPAGFRMTWRTISAPAQ